MNPHNLTWQEHAACIGLHRFFDGGQRRKRSVPDRARERVAKQICRNCPVLQPCTIWALHHYRDESAVIAGMTGPQRRHVRKRHGIPQPADLPSMKEWMAMGA